MNRELCLVICFIVGVLVFYLLKGVCGCKTVEGSALLTGREAETAAFYLVGGAEAAPLARYVDDELKSKYGSN